MFTYPITLDSPKQLCDKRQSKLALSSANGEIKTYDIYLCPG